MRQQADAIRRDCGVTVAEISSAGHHGKLPTAVWCRMADEFQVVVVTAQILLDALRQGYWNMTRVKKRPLSKLSYVAGKSGLYLE